MTRETTTKRRRALALAFLAATAFGCSSKFDPPGPADRDLTLQERLAPLDGAIVSVVPAGVDETWVNQPLSVQARFDRTVWESARTSLDGRADFVTYSSDGLRIGGFLVRPERIEGRRLAAVVVNRDGVAGRGLDENEILVELSRYADEGYVAATSAYRGNRLSQGEDELGGDDVNDVLALVKLLQRLDYVDPSRIFMVGFGRGGLMTYRALELGAPVRAAAVIAGFADLDEIEESDPEIESGFEDAGGWPGLESIYEGDWTDGSKEAQLERRTPRLRADALEVPLFIAHGRLDETVPVAQALDVAARLGATGTPLEAVIYGYGDHGLTDERQDWQARVMEWLNRHDTRAMFN